MILLLQGIYGSPNVLITCKYGLQKKPIFLFKNSTGGFSTISIA